MNRRGFLKLLTSGTAALAATAVFDPELALWVPGARTFFLPSLTPSWPTEWMTREALDYLNKDLVFARMINRRYDNFNFGGAKIGTTLNVRTPQRFAASRTP